MNTTFLLSILGYVAMATLFIVALTVFIAEAVRNFRADKKKTVPPVGACVQCGEPLGPGVFGFCSVRCRDLAFKRE